MSHHLRTAAGLVFALIVGAGSSQAQSYKVLIHFGDGSGALPLASLVEASDGRLYGTTRAGGRHGQGTIYRLTPGSGRFETIYSFRGPDGAWPSGALIEGRDGALYGTTAAGGGSGSGTIFRLSRERRLKVLHSFDRTSGMEPAAGLIEASDGHFYGTTVTGGAGNSGTIFRFDYSGRVKVLHAFDYWTTGGGSYAALVEARDGSFYGTTLSGGAANMGTVFRMDRRGTVAVLHAFDGTAGAFPFAALIQARDSFLYGTTSSSVFRMTAAGHMTVLRTAGSRAALVEARDGYFYGTTVGDESAPDGTVFRMDHMGTAKLLHRFDVRTTGRSPHATLVQASNGDFYGVSQIGGPGGDGTLIRMHRSGRVRVAHAFGDARGLSPFAGLVQGAGGWMYGTTLTGGAGGLGTVFRVNTAGASSLLHAFGDETGGMPLAPLIRGNDGFFYGTTLGSLFKMNARGDATLLKPLGSGEPLLAASDGFLYGTQDAGGAHGRGAIFRLARNGRRFSLVHSFDGTTGADPNAALIEAGDGSFYGTTSFGGAYELGTVFRMTRAGDVTVLHSFNCEQDDLGCVAGSPDGITPQAALLEASDGAFYGTTIEGGAANAGTIFRIDRAGAFMVLHSFRYDTTGIWPRAELIEAKDGFFYGTTQSGGPHRYGTVFRIDRRGRFELVHAFDNANGAYPFAALMQGEDGALYGTASEGGRYGGGVVFRITPPRRGAK